MRRPHCRASCSMNGGTFHCSQPATAATISPRHSNSRIGRTGNLWEASEATQTPEGRRGSTQILPLITLKDQNLYHRSTQMNTDYRNGPLDNQGFVIHAF